jgi:hypothetical protein
MVYSYSLSQQIFTADEIGVAGDITSIAFNYAYTDSFTMEDIHVYMMQVDKSVFESNTDMVPLTDATKVFEGTFSANGAGWVTLQLNTPFPYDGESNLLVCCFDPNSSKPGSSYKFYTTSTTGYTSIIYFDNNRIPDTTNVSTPTGSKAYYKYRNNIQLVIAPNNCQKPSTLEVNGSTLSWTEGSGSYNVEYRKASETNWTRAYTNLAATTCTLTLDPNTDYEARVQSACSGDETSGWRTISFTTPCGIVTVDATHSWSEGFESYNDGTSTSSGAAVTDIRCWERVQINSTTNSPFVYRNYEYSASTGLASLELKTSNGTTVMVALPEFSEAIENLNVAFNYNCTSTSYIYTAELGYISDVANASTFVKLFDIPTPVTRSTGHSSYSQDLYEATAAANAPEGSRVAIKFGTTTTSTPSWNLDDFVVSYVSPCRKPSGLTIVANSITTHSATLTWDAEAGATFQWTIDGTWNETQNNTVELTGLTSEHNYTFTLRKKCSNTEFSNAVSVNFTTPIACPAPTNLTVSNITGHTATASWNGSSDGYNVYLGSLDPNGNVLNVNFTNGIPSNWTNSTPYPWIVTDGYIKSSNAGVASSTSSISVTVTFPANGTVEFDAECMGEGTNNYYDYCYFNIDDTRLLYAGANISGWNHYTFDVTAGQHTFTWSYTKDNSVNPTGDYFAIDNVVMVAASIVWSNPVYVENTEYTFNGLAAESRYFVKVESNCGNGGVSTVAGPVAFDTDVACTPPTNLYTTDVTAREAMLHWDGNAESYNVSYYKTFFFDSFEEDLSQWTIYHEGDPGSWEWAIENPHDNSADLNAHSGYYAAVAYSDIDIHADSWLITPQIQFPNQTTLKFWIMRSTYDDAQDEYEVRLSTTGNAISDFTTVLKEKAAANPYWTEVSIDLSQYDGQQCYIAIRHDYTGGFFLMVDDFSIFGWSEDIVTTVNSLLIEDLLPESEYQWHVQANCGAEDGLSQWSDINIFTTFTTCPVPDGLNASNETAHGATLDWTGLSDSYQVMVGELLVSPISHNFEDHTIPSTWTNNSTYPWIVVSGGQNGSYCIQSGNAGQASTTSSISFTMTLPSDGTIDFDAQCRGEGTSYDVCKFLIDNTTKFTKGENGEQWDHYSYEVTAGEHTFTWSYTKDASVNSQGDYFAVDNIVIGCNEVASWTNYTITEMPFILDDAQHIHPETSYTVQVKGFCDDEETDFCEPIIFTTTVTCMPVDSLSFTNLTANSVNLNWVLLDETQTAWQICLNGDESNLITADTNEDFLLGGLEPETEYTVKVRAFCDENDQSRWSDMVTFTTPISCYPVNSLSYDNQTAFSVNLSWVLVDETQTAWQICLNENETNLVDANTNEGFLLDNLTPNVEYTVKVRAYCGQNDYSRWSNTVTFTTPEVCPTPKNLAAANITAVSADLSWMGREDVESYTVRYRTAEGLVIHFKEDFSDNIDSWTMVDCVTGTGLRFGAFAFYRATDANPHQYLISPEVTSHITGNSVLEFKYRAFSSSYAETFMVGVSTTNDEIGSFSWSEPITVSTDAYQTYHANLPAGTKYIAIQCTSYRAYYLYIDDITIGNEAIPGQWMTETSVETEAQLINLNGGTPYEVQVRSDCNPDGWSDMITFETELDGTKVFVEEGDWNEADHWIPEGVPGIDNRVIIRADVTIPSGYVAEANRILFEGTTLTIADGGQLIANNAVEVTAQKAIQKYNVAQTIDETLTDGWYFIASPITEAYTPEGSMTNNTYDLYRLNQTTWENFKGEAHPNFTTLANGQGYLYANSGNVTLSFNGTTKPYSTESNTVYVSEGWNLVGNPYTFETYVNQSYFKMNDAGTAIEAINDNAAIAPCTGIIVQATGAGTVAFTKEAQQQAANSGNIQIALAQATNTRGAATVIDNAIVSFNEGSTLPKFRFGDHAEIYIPQGSEDYAIAFSEAHGEMPLNFKATRNGTYTITVNTENVEMGYMHLIDNMTGADVDLLAIRSYTFEANTTDYESRFRLVFSAETENASFVYFNGSEWVVNGKGTMQLVDMTGRVLSSENVNGVATVNTNGLSAGVYVMRLVNGNDVKTQKIVVR